MDPGDGPLTGPAARKLAKDLFTGAASPAWAARNRRARKLLAKVLGEKAPSAAASQRPPNVDGPILSPSRAHRDLDIFARRQIDALLAGQIAAVCEHLAAEVWVLWPDTRFGLYPREVLAATFAERDLSATGLEPTKIKSYAAAEARAAFAHGIPEALDELFGLRSILLYSFAVGTFGRFMIAVRPTDTGAELCGLPLPSVDEGWAYSVRALLDEDDALRVSSKLTRHLVLGHGVALESMRGDLMPTLWHNGEIIKREDLFANARARGHRIEGAERIFGESAVLTEPLQALVGRTLANEIRRNAAAMWRETFDSLRPSIVETMTIAIDPKTLGPGEEHPIVTLMLRTEEPDGTGGMRERQRVGAIFDAS